MDNNNNIDLLKNLQEIGTKLSDFEEMPGKEKKYTLLGKGNFGYTEKMKSKKNNSIYAIKKLDINKKNFNLKSFHREIGIMSDLNHPNLVRLYGCFEDIEKIDKFKEIYSGKIKDIEKETEDKHIYCLVLEYVPNGTLEEYYEKNKEKNKDNFVPIEQDFIIKIFKQILDALSYLFNRSIMHRDIKPDNILLDENNNVKISDFGISAIYFDENPENLNKNQELFSNCTRVGRKDFVPPEIMKGQSYDFRVDIFSLGLTMLCLMSKEYPITLFKEKNANEKSRNINVNNMDESYDKNLRQFVLKLMNDDITLRPFANRAYEELTYIEIIIKEPNNENAKKRLQELNDPKNQKVQIKLNIKNKQNMQNNQNNQNYNMMNPNYNNYQVYPNQNFQMNQSYQYQNYNPQMMQNYPYQQNNMYIQNYSYNQNMPDYYQNQITNNNSDTAQKSNTSLIRVLQFLYNESELGEMSNKLIIQTCPACNHNTSICLNLINIINLIGNNTLNENDCMASVEQFKEKLSLTINRFKDQGEIKPNLIIFELFMNYNKELQSYNLPWRNYLFNDLIEPTNLPKSSFPSIYETIEVFKRDLNGPLVYNFYFLMLNLIKCAKCNNIIDVKHEIVYFIQLPGKERDKISNIIKNCMCPKNLDDIIYTCNKCSYRGLGKREKAFFNSPQYLIIDFAGLDLKEKNLENELDLTEYIMSNKGPKKYSLCGFISKENNGKYMYYFKDIKGWHLCSDINNMEDSKFDTFNFCFPNIAIYKGERTEN